MKPIGILSLQGGVAEHAEHLAALGLAWREVRTAPQLEGLAGLILPGGESSCLSRLLAIFGLDVAIRALHAAGVPIWGTCAGAILLANQIQDEAAHLQLLDITIARNAFGSQLDSFNRTVSLPELDAAPIPLVFIRAPKITATGPGVRRVMEMDGFVAAAEDDHVLATVFHPELTPSLAFHRHFAKKCGLTPADRPPEGWNGRSWTRFAATP
jgi:5'-phosphate synthase pdxT subunit